MNEDIFNTSLRKFLKQVGINAKTQRPRPKGANRAPLGRLRNTNIVRSRNAYTIERQYIRAIRSFSLVSNLGCRGVNRRGMRVTRKPSCHFRGPHRKCW